MKNKMSKTKNIVVIGGGSWGGALADQLLKANNNVTVLTRRRETADALNQGSLIALPQVQLEHPIPSTTNPDCLSFADLIVIAVPLSETAQVVEMIEKYASLNSVILFSGKGLFSHPEKGGIFLPEWIDSNFDNFYSYGLISGPSFADEVISNKPTAVMIASQSITLSTKIADYFEASYLRCYIGDDITGVAVGGAVKNIIAIAAGIATGLELGDNARAALVSRGLAEITRLAVKIGGRPQTLNGLAGMGDLVLSCSSPHSRNMAFGMAIAKNQTPDQKLAEGKKAAELLNARALYENIELPIAQAVHRILQHKELIESEINALLAREANTE